MPEVRLHGREDEQRHLAGFLGRAGHGPPGTLIVSGQTGIGKTRLLREAAQHARQRGLTVHHHSAAHLRALVSTGPARGSRPPGDRALLVLDDVEAVTAAEIHHLIHTARQVSAPAPALLLARAAKAPGTPFGQPVRAAPGAPVDRLELAPLTSVAVRDLVRDLIGVPPKAGLLDVVNCANGNPRLIVELVEGLAEEGRIGPAGDLIRLTPRQLPLRVRVLTDDHLRQLSKESVQLLRVGTILGRTFPLSQAAAMLSTSTAVLLTALDETMATGLLTLADDEVSFQHPLIWRAVYESIPQGVRAALHREARQHARGPATPAHDPVAPGRRARTQEPYTGTPSGVSTTGAVRTLLRTGHVESAVLLVRGALDRPRPAREELMLRRLLTDILLAGGHADAVFSGSVFAADGKTGPLPPADPVPLTDAWADTVIDQLARTGAESARTAAVALSGLEWAEGRTAQALHWGRRAVDHPETPDTPADRAHPRLALAAKLVALGDLQEAADLLRQALPDQPAEGDTVLRSAATLVHATAHLRAGDTDAARQQARSVLSAATGAALPVLAAWAAATLCRTEILAGDLDAAAGHLARCREHGGTLRTVPYPAPCHHWLGVVLHVARNDIPEAAALLASSPVPLPSLQSLLLAEPGAAAWFVRLSRRITDTPLADTALRAVERLAADNPDVPAVQLAAQHARSLYECDPDGIARAAAEHRDAWARACAAEDLKALLNERQVTSRAAPRTPASRHRTWPTRDHVGWMALVDAVPHHGQPTPEPATDPLRDIERTIAALVATGLTNRQVAQRVHLSPHTVNYYLRRIYRKLGIRSRIELARRIADQDPGFWSGPVVE
ncbi:LuxR C-terminal-related transcriptional regulator [Streptomyces sp. NPDC002514]|uniref:helix-turn-helix transcriptional regulator n=1 Tax=Streptomyces sp. NPDC001270 TaxID=3364554 RepID=UPI00368CC016